jgi:hypothetical protein
MNRLLSFKNFACDVQQNYDDPDSPNLNTHTIIHFESYLVINGVISILYYILKGRLQEN